MRDEITFDHDRNRHVLSLSRPGEVPMSPADATEIFRMALAGLDTAIETMGVTGRSKVRSARDRLATGLDIQTRDDALHAASGAQE